MFFKNAKETTASYTNSLIDLIGMLFKRYLSALNELWLKDKKQAVLIYIGIFLLFILSIIITNQLLSDQTNFNSSDLQNKNNTSSVYRSRKYVEFDAQSISHSRNSLKIHTLESRNDPTFSQDSTLNIQQLDDTVEPIGGNFGDSVYQTINALKNIVAGFKPILDVFVSNTPDVTGISTNQVNFATGSFDTAKTFSNKLLGLVISVYTLFLILEGIIILKDINTKKQRDIGSIVMNHVFTIIILISTPYILSYSIIGVNAFCQFILGGKDLTSFLVEFLDKIQQGFQPNSDQSPLSILLGGIQTFANPVKTLFDGFRAFLALFPIVLIALLYILVIGQFVIRFIKLYFLAAIYPIVIIFMASPIKTDYVGRYWNTWITTLLHQAFFIFGYAIIQGFLLNMLANGVGIEQIVILIGSLIFLYNVNSFSSEIIGGVVHRGGNAINAVIGDVAGGSIGAVLFGQKAAMQSVGGGNTSHLQNSGLSKREAFTGFLPGSTNKSSGFNKSSKSTGFGSSNVSTPKSNFNSNNTGSATNSKHNQLADITQSKQAQAFSKNNYAVSPVYQEEGVIGVEGNWWAYNQSNGITTLYNSKEDALEDRVPASDIYPVSGKFNLQDTSNYAGRTVYEERSGVELGVNATDSNMKKSLTSARFENKEKGIDGITTTQVSKNQKAKLGSEEKINKDTPRIQKTTVYTKNLNKTNNT